MAGPTSEHDPPHDRAAQDTVLRDWHTIWRSELAAQAGSPEMARLWARWFAMWQEGVRALSPLRHAGADPPPRPAGPGAPAGAAPVAAASDARDARIEQLAERVAELERQLNGSSTKR